MTKIVGFTFILRCCPMTNVYPGKERAMHGINKLSIYIPNGWLRQRSFLQHSLSSKVAIHTQHLLITLYRQKRYGFSWLNVLISSVCQRLFTICKVIHPIQMASQWSTFPDQPVTSHQPWLQFKQDIFPRCQRTLLQHFHYARWNSYIHYSMLCQVLVCKVLLSYLPTCIP